MARHSRDLVQPALAQQSEEAQLLDALHIREAARRVHVADRDVTLLPQGVIGQVVTDEILMDVAIAPVDDRMNLEALG